MHPTCNLCYLLHWRIIVKEPREKPGQECVNTKTYCNLRSVYVIGGNLHATANCKKSRQDFNAKNCSNCGGPCTANYRGCSVYVEIDPNCNWKNEFNVPRQTLLRPAYLRLKTVKT